MTVIVLMILVAVANGKNVKYKNKDKV
jgi:hypothetical protein